MNSFQSESVSNTKRFVLWLSKQPRVGYGSGKTFFISSVLTTYYSDEYFPSFNDL